MAYEVTMPRLGWTMEEGIFGEWLKQDGDKVQAGDLLFTVEGDKATQEVEVFEGGILRLPPNAPVSGDVIPVGALLAYIVQAGESLPQQSVQAAEPASQVETQQNFGGAALGGRRRRRHGQLPRTGAARRRSARARGGWRASWAWTGPGWQAVAAPDESSSGMCAPPRR